MCTKRVNLCVYDNFRLKSSHKSQCGNTMIFLKPFLWYYWHSIHIHSQHNTNDIPISSSNGTNMTTMTKICTNQTWHELIIVSKSIHVELNSNHKRFSILLLAWKILEKNRKHDYILHSFGSTIARITAKVDHKKSNRENNEWKMMKTFDRNETKQGKEEVQKTTTTTTSTAIYSLENLIDPFPFKKKEQREIAKLI